MRRCPQCPQLCLLLKSPSFTSIKWLRFLKSAGGKQTVDIQPMEQFNQGWGTILYRTTLPETTLAGTTLKITEVHDWAQIYADGKLLARLDRRKGEFTTTLPALKKRHTTGYSCGSNGTC